MNENSIELITIFIINLNSYFAYILMQKREKTIICVNLCEDMMCKMMKKVFYYIEQLFVL